MRSAAKWVWFFVFAAFVGGFLLLDTSGLLGREQITTSTVVAEVNGIDIPYMTWANLSNALAQQQERATGKGLTLDERRQIDDQAFEQLVNSVLLQEEYRRRGIGVTDDEIIRAAQVNPPPDLMQSPELQTDGQFDIEKYQRLLRSPAARQQGLLLQLENYYRNEIPRSKLYDQLASDVYISDAKLWTAYRDTHDSAVVSFVTFEAASVPDSAVRVSEEEIRAFYSRNREQFRRGGRAVLSLLTIPRVISAADSAHSKARAEALRDEIVKGAKFEDVARRESSDSASGANGGALGMSGRGRFIAEFEKAAFALRPGEISQPVISSFGYHLIRVDSRKGDSIDVRHILIPIQQGDSSAAQADRLADQLARVAASATEPARFDSASRLLNLAPENVQAFEGQPVLASRGVVPSVSAWAFGGAGIGETSDLFDAENAYYVARLDSLREGGIPAVNELRAEIHALLIRKKKAESLLPTARAFASDAATKGLEAAARARNMTVSTSPMFNRGMFVAGLGRMNAAIGAAFGLPLNVVSNPVITDDGAYVLRVDRRVEASREEFEKQKEQQRTQATNAMRQQRIRSYLDALRKTADVEDRRKQLNAAARAQAS
jgi:peptidyl-prolyl cis-trans isomerase D